MFRKVRIFYPWIGESGYFWVVLMPQDYFKVVFLPSLIRPDLLKDAQSFWEQARGVNCGVSLLIDETLVSCECNGVVSLYFNYRECRNIRK